MRNGHVSRRSRSGQDTSLVPTLECLGPHEWKFPESAWEVSERFYTGCELWEAGNTQEAFAVFQDLLQRPPEHLGVRDSLAYVYEEIGQDDRAMWNIPSQVSVANSPVVPRSIKQRGWSRCVGAPRAMITAENGHKDRTIPHLQNALHIPIRDRRIRTLLLLVWGHRDRRVTPLHTCM